MRFPVAVLTAALALTTTACSESGSASQPSSGPISVQVSQMFLTVKNDAGVPLNDVTVSIVPPTRSAVFTKYVGRFENSESRDIMLGDFSSRDGTPFNLRVVTPKSVEVKGTGVDGKTYDVSVPWK